MLQTFLRYQIVPTNSAVVRCWRVEVVLEVSVNALKVGEMYWYWWYLGRYHTFIFLSGTLNELCSANYLRCCNCCNCDCHTRYVNYYVWMISVLYHDNHEP